MKERDIKIGEISPEAKEAKEAQEAMTISFYEAYTDEDSVFGKLSKEDERVIQEESKDPDKLTAKLLEALSFFGNRNNRLSTEGEGNPENKSDQTGFRPTK